MSPTVSDHIDYLTRQAQREQDKRKGLERRLADIHEMAEAELDRIERYGGCCGFALRIRKMSKQEAR